MPFNGPICLAEEIAFTDILSRGHLIGRGNRPNRSDDALSVLVPILEDIVGYDSRQIPRMRTNQLWSPRICVDLPIVLVEP